MATIEHASFLLRFDEAKHILAARETVAAFCKVEATEGTSREKEEERRKE